MNDPLSTQPNSSRAAEDSFFVLRDAQARVVASPAIFDIAAERALCQLAGT